MRHSQETAGLVLVVEDNRNISEMIGEYLEGRGFEVDYATDGLDGYRLAVENSYDVLVLDLMLPRLDGMEVCKRLRNEARKSTPVLMLTARDTLDDKLTGLSSGADDYLTKPLHLEEVVLRLRALVRRTRGHADPVLRVGALAFDTLSSRFTLDGQPLTLTAQEQRILAYLMHRPDQVVSRSEIGEHVYARDLEPDSNTVDVLIGRIRRKLGRPLIHTERGLGFRLSAPATPPG